MGAAWAASMSSTEVDISVGADVSVDGGAGRDVDVHRPDGWDLPV